MHRFVGSALFPAAALVIVACGSSHSNSSEQPLSDASAGDGSHDAAGRTPSLVPDGGLVDAAVPDAMYDAAVPDAGAVDSGRPADTGAPNAVADASTGPVADSAAPADGAMDAPQPLNDAQIIGILEGLDTSEIQESLLATGNPDDGAVDVGLEAGAPAFDAGAGRSSNPSVVGYANMIAIDDAQSSAGLDSFGIAAAPSDMLTMLQNGVQSTDASLSPLSGQAFDLAYAQDQVAENTRLRDLVTNQLAPAAQNPQLQAYLTGTLLPLIQVHLLAANALVGQLNDGGVMTSLPAPAPLGTALGM
jgi:predicted outer membrane protein